MSRLETIPEVPGPSTPQPQSSKAPGKQKAGPSTEPGEPAQQFTNTFTLDGIERFFSSYSGSIDPSHPDYDAFEKNDYNPAYNSFINSLPPGTPIAGIRAWMSRWFEINPNPEINLLGSNPAEGFAGFAHEVQLKENRLWKGKRTMLVRDLERSRRVIEGNTQIIVIPDDIFEPFCRDVWRARIAWEIRTGTRDKEGKKVEPKEAEPESSPDDTKQRDMKRVANNDANGMVFCNAEGFARTTEEGRQRNEDAYREVNPVEQAGKYMPYDHSRRDGLR